MIPFRMQNGTVIELDPEATIRTGWDRTTARAMLPGESGHYQPIGATETIHVFRLEVPKALTDHGLRPGDMVTIMADGTPIVTRGRP